VLALRRRLGPAVVLEHEHGRNLPELRETEDPVTKLRERLGLSDDEFDEVDREVTQVVEESVEFAKSGTDPAPEDALKNVYADG